MKIIFSKNKPKTVESRPSFQQLLAFSFIIDKQQLIKMKNTTSFFLIY
ncbi:hypothetical protein RV14_GL000010 [Enterococcus ratti]|uniref:Uncharacterized protein n=1 Tax=Enterococcus ratti TaxID=150033 RepID=A0A1L8WS56_9ENTE|nr:hypothetical protein RV14_GL000010 [Enterococcus ratti]